MNAERKRTSQYARLLIGEIRYAALFAFLAFAPARTLDWPRAWILIAVAFVVRTLGGVSVIQVGSGLLDERSKIPIHKDQPTIDKILLPAFMATFAGVVVMCSVDRFHLRLFPEPGFALSHLGLAAVIVGWTIVMASLRANAFATTVVRHQVDRQHHLVDHGVYAWVRHPMYMGIIPVMLGLSLWLGSYAGMIFSIIPIAILAVRVIFEERVLRNSLSGYDEYANRVTRRLIPFVW